MTQVWVKVNSPHGQFAQSRTEIDPETGQTVTVYDEHVRAETVAGKQVPVPVLVTMTRDVERALGGDRMKAAQPDHPVDRGAQLELCTDKEVEAYLAGELPQPAPHTPDWSPR